MGDIPYIKNKMRNNSSPTKYEEIPTFLLREGSDYRTMALDKTQNAPGSLLSQDRMNIAKVAEFFARLLGGKKGHLNGVVVIDESLDEVASALSLPREEIVDRIRDIAAITGYPYKLRDIEVRCGYKSPACGNS